MSHMGMGYVLKWFQPDMYLKYKVRNLARYATRRRQWNVFHCCLQKTATQWFMGLLREAAQSSGVRLLPLTGGNVIPRPRGWEERLRAIPDGTIVTPLYIRAPDFLSIYDGRPFKAFYVFRDPRDIVVSDYFSLKKTHPIQNEYYAEWRHRLNTLSQVDGISARIENMDWNFFTPLREWAEVRDPRILLLKYEEFFGDGLFENTVALLEHLEISVGRPRLEKILEARSFAKLSKLPGAGSADASSHYRKGTPGDWRNHFTAEHIGQFKAATGDLLIRLGYESSGNW